MGGKKRSKSRKTNFDHLRTFPKGTTFDFDMQPAISSELQMRRAAEVSLLAALSPKTRHSPRRSPKRSPRRSPKRSPERTTSPRSLTKFQMAHLVMKHMGATAPVWARMDVQTLHPPHRTGHLDVTFQGGVLRFFARGKELFHQDVREDTLAKINVLPQTLASALHLVPLW